INFKKSRDKDRTFNPLPVRIKVLGVGGAGCSIVSRVFSQNWKNISFMVCDTSVKTLASCEGMDRFLLGESVTKGWGTGGDREIAKKIAQEAEKDIRGLLDDVDLLFLVCSLSKGLGAGASPVFLKVAREKGLLTIGFFILPFNFEGEEKVAEAKDALEKLWQMVDGAVVVSNNVLLNMENSNPEGISTPLSLKEAFMKIDEVFKLLVSSIGNILYTPGIISLDFADIKSFLGRGRQIIIAAGKGSGERRIEEAVEQVFYSPLWGKIPLKKTKGILLIIRGGENFELKQLERIILSLKKQVNPSVPVNFGVYTENNLSDEILLTLMLSSTRNIELEMGEEKSYQQNLKLDIYDDQDLDVPTFLRKQHN
ncbi:hypothetical protein DRI96_01680, partial [Candidatus Aerophobetes bacterium]